MLGFKAKKGKNFIVRMLLAKIGGENGNWICVDKHCTGKGT
jgi:hypothetical protein